MLQAGDVPGVYRDRKEAKGEQEDMPSHGNCMPSACLPAIWQMVIANNEREEAAKLAGSKVHLN